MQQMLFSKLEVTTVSKKDMVELEAHIVVNMEEFMRTDISSLLACFFKLNHSPQNLIDEVIKQNKLSTFSQEGTFFLLYQLVANKIDTQPELCTKLWDRLEQLLHSSKNSNNHNYVRTLVKY